MNPTATPILHSGRPSWLYSDGTILPRTYGADPNADPPDPAAAPTPAQLSGPWASDVVQTFTDPAMQAQVDAFLRTKVQPHVTRLETRTSELQAAGELLEDLREDPQGTYLAIAEQLYPDQVDELRALLDPSAPEEPETPTSEPAPAAEPVVPPEVQELLEERRAAKAQEAYAAEVEKLRGRTNDERIDPQLLSPFVVAADGDVDKAYESYQEWVSKLTPEGTGPSPEEVPNPPAAMGSDTQVPPSGTPPLEQNYGTIDDAMDAMFAEINPAPAAVGTV